jgi:hypothetical protein
MSINVVMAGPDPATHRVHVRARVRLNRCADARLMGGRLKAAHDG